MQPRQFDRTPRLTDGRVMQEWWKEGTRKRAFEWAGAAAAWMQNPGSMFPSQNNQAWLFPSVKGRTLETAPGTSAAFSTQLGEIAFYEMHSLTGPIHNRRLLMGLLQ